jgi:hypothetical protein
MKQIDWEDWAETLFVAILFVFAMCAVCLMMRDAAQVRGMAIETHGGK